MSRSRVRWQDALLSICHDRPPAIYSHGWALVPQQLALNDLSYAEVMHRLSDISIEFMQRKALNFWADKSLPDFLSAVDALYATSKSYLRETAACKDLSQLLEHYALKMHLSFFITYICRPAIRNSTKINEALTNDNLSVRAQESLIRVCQAFMDFQALSIVPRRTWSMIHEALSAVLLLYVWDKTRHDTNCRLLQQQVVDIFTNDITDETTNDNLASRETTWLSPQHIRTLLSLRDALGHDQPHDISAENQSSTPADAVTEVYADTGAPGTDPFAPFSSLE